MNSYLKLIASSIFLAFLVGTFFLWFNYKKVEKNTDTEKRDNSQIYLQESNNIKNNTSNYKLKLGKVVYISRDTDKYGEFAPTGIYTILSNGSDKKLIYNGNSVGSIIPYAEWATDKRIVFIEYKDGAWKRFSINEDGTDVKLIGDAPPGFWSSESFSKGALPNELVFKAEVNNPEIYGFYFISGLNKTRIDSVDLRGCKEFCSPEFLIEGVRLTSDKKYVTYVYVDDIILAKTDGTEYRKLAKGFWADFKYLENF